jgi:virginiamycin B lyase
MHGTARLWALALGLICVIVASGAAALASDPPTTDIDKAGAKKLDVQGDWLAAGAGGVWLSAPGDKLIRRLDPRSGAVKATIQVPQDPCEATAVGLGSLWTATCGTPGLARIDPATNKVSGFVKLAIPSSLDGEGSIGAGAGGVWLVIDGQDCTRCRVARVDPKSLRVVDRIPVREGSAAVRTGLGAVWVTNPTTNIVQKIEPRTNRVVATTNVAGSPRFFDVGEGGVWTLSQMDGAVTRLAPSTARMAASIKAEVAGGGGDLTVGGGWVWARGSSVLLVRIDPRTNRVVERYGPPSGSGAAIVGFGAVWISAHDVNTVWRLPLPKA